ncbi:ATPase, T2SS/T4P/T4SS family [Thiobacter aerophilum]|uniref:ATPase, T2SS/T4P/T4SS family n=1 Tax=Thiobacter aerophilum TaxID=3121275 RepID=A0ABV0EJR1_9BURK
MFSVTITDSDGTTVETAVNANEALLGRGRHCAVQLAGWRIGREHARLLRAGGGLYIEDLGQLAGTWVNGARVVRHGPLDFADEIVIGGYRIRVKDRQPAEAPVAAEARERATLEYATPSDATPTPTQPHNLDAAAIQGRYLWRKRIHERLLDTIDLRRRDLTRMTEAELRKETESLVRELIEADPELPPTLDRDALLKEVLNEAIGLGPLEELLADEGVTEIMVNRFDQIYVERNGRLEPYPLSFTSDRAVMGVIERIVAPIGRRIDESSPMVDARLKDGSRVNAIIPPLALKGPTLTIRKFAQRRLTIDDLLAYGSLSAAMGAFLRVCVEQRKNIVVSGGTGSGKTTFLNVLSNFIPDGERVITIEDAAELKLHHANLVSLEARPANLEGRGQVTIRDLVRNALRMRPDRIVVGECRGGEALDMLQAMNTGHDGSLTTLHANSPRDALARLETLVLMAGMDLPLMAIREQIASAVDIIVQQTRFACGARKVTSISEVTGMEGGTIQLQELFRFEQHGYGDDGGVRGRFVAGGIVPSFYEELRARGATLDLSMFDGGEQP